MSHEDVRAVAKLYCQLSYHFQEESTDAYWDFENLAYSNFVRQLRRALDSEEHKVFVAKDEEEVVGFISGEIMESFLSVSDSNKVGYISSGYVDPEYRGQGIVKALEEQVIDFFRASGMKYVEVNFLSNNQLAKKAWEQLGYKTFREQARKSI